MNDSLDAGWRTSAPHAALLAKFRSPTQPDRFDETYGMPALREPPPRAVRRFVEEGFIRPSPPEEKLDALRVAELKNALKGQGLKVSGRKAALIERLLGEAPAEAEALAKDLPETWGLSDVGRQHVERYLAWEKARAEAAIQGVRTALESGDLEAAVRRHAAYAELDVWADPSVPYRPAEKLAWLRSLAQLRSGILRAISDADMGRLRLATALTGMFGREAKPFLPTGFANACHLDEETAARMLSFHVQYRERLAKMSEDPGLYERLAVSACDDERRCSACRELAARTYTLRDLPELPFPSCTSEMGCRCLVTVVFDE